MVRRTRGFIQQNYAQTDPETGRKYLTFEDGSLSYFPVRHQYFQISIMINVIYR